MFIPNFVFRSKKMETLKLGSVYIDLHSSLLQRQQKLSQVKMKD